MTIRSMPPRTYSDVWREKRAKTKKLEYAVSGYSVGIGFTRNSIDGRGTTNTPAAGGLGNAGWASGEGSWNGSVSEFVYKKSRQNPRIATVHAPKIECISDIVEDYNGDGDLGVILQFRGFGFLGESFTKSRNDYGQNTCIYYICVRYGNKEAFLILSTIGDILESEVVPQKKGVNQLFSDEIHIPELTAVYDPSSMGVVQRNGLILVSYKQNN